MTPEKAIKRLASNDLLFWKSKWKEDKKAIKLGIEALKRVQDMRTHPWLGADELLPGETKE